MPEFAFNYRKRQRDDQKAEREAAKEKIRRAVPYQKPSSEPEPTPDSPPPIYTKYDDVVPGARTQTGIIQCQDRTFKNFDYSPELVEITGDSPNLERHRENILANFGGSQKEAERHGYIFSRNRILQPKYRTTGVTQDHVDTVRKKLELVGDIVKPKEIRIDNIGLDGKGNPYLLDHSCPVVKKKDNRNEVEDSPIKKEESSTNSTPSPKTEKENLAAIIQKEKDKFIGFGNKILIAESKTRIKEIEAAEKRKKKGGWTLKATFEFEFPGVELSSEDWENITQDFDMVKNSFVAEVIQNYKLLQFIVVIASKLQNNDSKTFVINYVESLKQFYANSESDAAKLALKQPSYFKVFQSLLKRDYKLALASLPNLRNKILADFMIMFIDYQENRAEGQADLSESTNRIINSYQAKFSEPKGLNFYRSIKTSNYKTSNYNCS